MGDLSGLNDPQQRYNRLLGYLVHDPENLNLIADACTMSLDLGYPDKAVELLDRYAALAPLPPTLVNLAGIAALRQDRFTDAAAIFESLLEGAPQDPSLRYNLAWAKTMTGDHEAAAQLLDEVVGETVPGAAALKVQALHRLGDLEAALEHGAALAEKRPHDTALLGALSLVAVDMQMPELAQQWAQRSADTAEGLSTLGVLLLRDNHIDEALACFERGLEVRPDSARNLLGKGLARMAAGDAAGAADYLDQSAEQFGTHLGTWIAAGWAHFTAGDPRRARTIFEHTLGLDDTFSETHGALAVMDILDGHMEAARRRTEIALRLDPRSFAGALAKTLLLEHDGDPKSAQRIRDIALNTPLESGRTIAQAMIVLAPNWRRNN